MIDYEKLVRDSLESLPDGCKSDSHHHWIKGSGPKNLLEANYIKGKGDVLKPYYVCEHCYAIGEYHDRISPWKDVKYEPTIVRVR